MLAIDVSPAARPVGLCSHMLYAHSMPYVHMNAKNAVWCGHAGMRWEGRRSVFEAIDLTIVLSLALVEIAALVARGKASRYRVSGGPRPATKPEFLSGVPLETGAVNIGGVVAAALLTGPDGFYRGCP